MLPSQTPEIDSFDGLVHPQWWLVNVEGGKEQRVAHDLESQGVPTYLPMVQRTRYYDDARRHTQRRVTVPVPYFGTYLFVFGHAAVSGTAADTSYVKKARRIADQNRFVRELVVVERKIEIDPVFRDVIFTQGMKCRVLAGTFMGFEGEVVEYRGAQILIVKLPLLGQIVNVSMDPAAVEPLDLAPAA